MQEEDICVVDIYFAKGSLLGNNFGASVTVSKRYGSLINARQIMELLELKGLDQLLKRTALAYQSEKQLEYFPGLERLQSVIVFPIKDLGGSRTMVYDAPRWALTGFGHVLQAHMVLEWARAIHEVIAGGSVLRGCKKCQQK